MKKNTIHDYDFDFTELMKDFPENDVDGFLYLRGRLTEGKSIDNLEGVHQYNGTGQVISSVIAASMIEDEFMQELIAIAVIQFSKEDGFEKTKFAQMFIGWMVAEKTTNKDE